MTVQRVAQIFGVVFSLAAMAGFGLVPLGGNDIWLHAVLAAGLLLFGLTAKERPTSS